MRLAVEMIAGFGLGALAVGVVPAADESASAQAELERVARLTRNVEQLSAAIAKEPERIPLYSQRGDNQLFLGRFKEAVGDFEKMIELDPAEDAPHWRLGIAYYFAGDFRKSARQFEKYHSYDARDRENGIWKFLAQARDAGLERARAEMLPYTQFDREPFPSLYEMFAGRKTSDELFQEIERKNLQENRLVIFFANYYAGVHEALLGRPEVAAGHLRKAVAIFDEERAKGGPSYMWQVARLHYEEIRRAAAKR